VVGGEGSWHGVAMDYIAKSGETQRVLKL